MYISCQGTCDLQSSLEVRPNFGALTDPLWCPLNKEEVLHIGVNPHNLSKGHCSQAISITCSRLWSLCPSPLPPNTMVMRFEAHIQPLLRMQASQGHCAFRVYYNPSWQKNGYSKKKNNFNISNTTFCPVRGMLSTKAVWFNYRSPCCLRARAQTDVDSSMWISPSWASAIFLGCRDSGSVCSDPMAMIWLNRHPSPSLSFFPPP